MPRAATKATEEFETDQELGIGSDGAASIDPIAALLTNPDLAKAFNAAVTAKAAQLSGGGTDNSTAALARAIERIVDLNAEQRPGHVKPLSADELEHRTAGRVEMFALLTNYEAANTPPLWQLGDFWYVGHDLIPKGKKLHTYEAPAEHFIPLNAEARAVYAAMMQWLGGRTDSIAEQVAAAERAARGSNAIPMVGREGLELAQSKRSFQLVNELADDVQSRRASAGDMPTAAPVQGPSFANA